MASGGLFLLVCCCGAMLAASSSSAAGGELQPSESGKGGRRKLGGETSPINDAYVSSYEIVNTFSHDINSFTQGLTFDVHGNLYESDGLYGKSMVRSVEVLTGNSKHKTANERSHFGEGLEVVGDRLVQLTWKEHTYHEYKLPSLEKLGSHPMPCYPDCKEGWGLAYDAHNAHLYLTDSTDKLFKLDPKTLKPTQPPMQIYDKKLGRAINGVNELEWVDGELWGNVFPMYQGTASECIVRINATDASVIGWIDMRGLLALQRAAVRAASRNYVLNGIAYHASSGRLYVTGKQWDHMYQVRIKPAASEEQTAKHVHDVCSLGRVSG